LKTIRLCQIVNNLDVGGIERLVIALLQSMPKDRFESHLVALSGPGKLFPQIALPASACLVLDKDDSRLRFPVVLRELRQFLDSRGIEVIHAHNLSPLVFGGLAARSLRPRPRMVYTDHAQVHDHDKRFFKREKFKLYAKLADELVGVSEDVARRIEGLRPGRPVSAIHNGIDGSRFATADGGVVRRELGIDPSAFVVGTAVRLAEQKGLRYLIEAAVTVVKAEPNIQFVVAGDGPLRQELTEQAARTDLGNRFRFLGYRADVPELVASFDVYALPSNWEGLPLSLLEALAAGKSIVTTTVGGNPEVVEDGVNGFLVPPRDPAALSAAILRAYRDQTFRAKVAATNRARFAAEFSIDAMVGHYASMFERLVGAR